MSKSKIHYWKISSAWLFVTIFVFIIVGMFLGVAMEKHFSQKEFAEQIGALNLKYQNALNEYNLLKNNYNNQNSDFCIKYSIEEYEREIAILNDDLEDYRRFGDWWEIDRELEQKEYLEALVSERDFLEVEIQGDLFQCVEVR